MLVELAAQTEALRSELRVLRRRSATDADQIRQLRSQLSHKQQAQLRSISPDSRSPAIRSSSSSPAMQQTASERMAQLHSDKEVLVQVKAAYHLRLYISISFSQPSGGRAQGKPVLACVISVVNRTPKKVVAVLVLRSV